MSTTQVHTFTHAACASRSQQAFGHRPSLLENYPNTEALTVTTATLLSPIRTSAPLRYLKRTGVIPRYKTLKPDSEYKPTILSSSSSASSANSSSPASPSIYKCSLVDQQEDCLPGLTESNLAKLMARLNSSSPSPSSSPHTPSGSYSQPENQFEEISRFSSDDSSASSDSVSGF